MLEPWQQLFESQIVDRFEGSIAWMYLDTDGLVTVGKGCQVGLAEALTLAFMVQGCAATPAEIEADYCRVVAEDPGLYAGYYRAAASPLLSNAGIEALVASRISAATSSLRAMFSDFYTWPDDAKIATLEMPWGLGMGQFQKWPHLIAALRRRDWQAAAAECSWVDSKGFYAQRNAHRMLLYETAAKEAVCIPTTS